MKKILTTRILLAVVAFFSVKATACEQHVSGDQAKIAAKVANRTLANEKETHADHSHEDNEAEKEKDGHGHGSENTQTKDNHDESEGHDDHAGHEGEEGGHGEENSKVGPDKGILEASAENGIRISPEAERNFEIQKIPVQGIRIVLPRAAIVTAGVEVNLFRYRDGMYKRIDFATVSRAGDRITVISSDLKTGDQIALTGLGFLRMAEIAAFGGAPDGHAH